MNNHRLIMEILIGDFAARTVTSFSVFQKVFVSTGRNRNGGLKERHSFNKRANFKNKSLHKMCGFNFLTTFLVSLTLLSSHPVQTSK